MPTESFTDSCKLNEQLSWIPGSTAFKSSQILFKFLRLIVSKTLKWNKEQLKEYVIGTEALKKDVDFNPQIHALIKIHAARLRKGLEDYYLNQGQHDPLLISMPKGW